MSTFDEERGNRYLRFSYAGTHADVVEAARRLQAWPRLKQRMGVSGVSGSRFERSKAGLARRCRDTRQT